MATLLNMYIDYYINIYLQVGWLTERRYRFLVPIIREADSAMELGAIKTQASLFGFLFWTFWRRGPFWRIDEEQLYPCHKQSFQLP